MSNRRNTTSSATPVDLLAKGTHRCDGDSDYARKRNFLASQSRKDGRRRWGFEFPDKPWKK